LFSSA
jgi:SNF2 family DNA or RNA helicase